MNEEFTHIRKDGSKAIFKNKEDYTTFVEVLERELDIDKEIDIWINWINKRLTERGLDRNEIKLFFERFKMAI